MGLCGDQARSVGKKDFSVLDVWDVASRPIAPTTHECDTTFNRNGAGWPDRNNTPAAEPWLIGLNLTTTDERNDA